MSDTDKLLKQLVMRSERRAEQAEETRLAMLDQLKSIELKNDKKLTQIERHLYGSPQLSSNGWWFCFAASLA